MNYAANGLNNANTVTVPLNAAGQVDIASNVGTTHVRLVAVAYYSASPGLAYVPVIPCAASDSRVNHGAGPGFAGPFAAGGAFPDIDVSGTFPTIQGGDNDEASPTRSCGVPDGADAAVVNLVAVNASGGSGYLAAGTGGTDPAEPSTPFASLGMNNATTVLAPLSAAGTLSIDIEALAGSPLVEVRVVVLGYLTSTGSQFHALNPCAAFDTRVNQGATGAFAGLRLGDQATQYQISGNFPTGSRRRRARDGAVPHVRCSRIGLGGAGQPRGCEQRGRRQLPGLRRRHRHRRVAS